ncbi:MAG TPA: Uma2 family endonuclease [Dehalococcoidia bacterium]|nr:Uma2 family endonuclease [Dehalococcoidia bacterium]
MTTEKTRLTAEQFFDLAGDGSRRYELLDGDVIEMTPPGGQHSGVTLQVAYPLMRFVEDERLNFYVGAEVGVILRRDPDRVRAPDLYLIARDRLPGGELPDAYLQAVPDLIVEVVSPHDRAAELEEKVEEWLRAGARLVWVCHPSTRTVHAHRGLADVRVYRMGEVLDAEPVLAGFAVPIERLFP